MKRLVFEVNDTSELNVIKKLITKHSNLSLEEGCSGSFEILFKKEYTHLNIRINKSKEIVELIPRTWADGDILSFKEAIIKINDMCLNLYQKSKNINNQYDILLKSLNN